MVFTAIFRKVHLEALLRKDSWKDPCARPVVLSACQRRASTSARQTGLRKNCHERNCQPCGKGRRSGRRPFMPTAALPVAVLLLIASVFAAACAAPSPTSTPAATRTGTATPTPTVSTPSPSPTPTATAVSTPSPTPTATPSPTPAPSTPPASYTSRVLLSGVGHPDDLAFDVQGNLLFSDITDGTINRLNSDGSVTTILNDPNGPEGMVVRPDGTIIFAEQITNRIVSLAPGATTPTVLRNLPGTNSAGACRQGVDGIAFDPTSNTIIVPDSPTGEVYRMSLDGATFTLLASGIVRPVGGCVDAQGNIFIADECGSAVWRIAPDGSKTRLGGFGEPDDIVLDGFGNLLVIDLSPSVHALLRVNFATGQRETIASEGFREPQGLAIDSQGRIYVSDDLANIVVQFTPASP